MKKTPHYIYSTCISTEKGYKQRLNAVVAFVLLLLFVWIMSVKGLHHHCNETDGRAVCESSIANSATSTCQAASHTHEGLPLWTTACTSDHCAICDFCFAPSEKPTISQLASYKPTFQELTKTENLTYHIPTIFFFEKRGPPTL